MINVWSSVPIRRAWPSPMCALQQVAASAKLLDDCHGDPARIHLHRNMFPRPLRPQGNLAELLNMISSSLPHKMLRSVSSPPILERHINKAQHHVGTRQRGGQRTENKRLREKSKGPDFKGPKTHQNDGTNQNTGQQESNVGAKTWEP